MERERVREIERSGVIEMTDERKRRSQIIELNYSS